jgi:hypothetical protein
MTWNVTGAIDGNEATGWAVLPQSNKQHEAIFETTADVGAAGGSTLTFEMVQQFPDGTHTLGKFRFSVTKSKRPLTLQKLPADITAAFTVAAEQRNAEQKATILKYFQSLDSEYQRLKKDVQLSEDQIKNRRLTGMQDLAWALINNPAFLFNR